MKKIISLLIVLTFSLAGVHAALADSVTEAGTVVNIAPAVISGGLEGKISEIAVSAGEHVSAGDAVAVLKTEKVYALQDGTVHLFGEAGDSAEMISDRYGAVVYLEPACQFTVSASTKNAYNQEENKTIHPGETVYLRYVSGSSNTGTGFVTSVSGTSYSVEVTGGSFNNGESVYIYRSADYASTSLIGKGSVSRQSPVAYTAEGVVVRFAVQDGASVHKGDVLFETLAGTFAGSAENPDRIVAPSDGVVASVSVNQGDTVSADVSVAEFYEDRNMRIQLTVSEENLHYYSTGSPVSIEFPYLGSGGRTLQGTVDRISQLGAADTEEEDSEDTVFTVWVIPQDTDGIFYGMNAVVSLSGMPAD